MQVVDTKEKVRHTAYGESTGIVDERVKMLLSESTKESDPQVDFYGGPQIFVSDEHNILLSVGFSHALQLKKNNILLLIYCIAFLTHTKFYSEYCHVVSQW